MRPTACVASRNSQSARARPKGYWPSTCAGGSVITPVSEFARPMAKVCPGPSGASGQFDILTCAQTASCAVSSTRTSKPSGKNRRTEAASVAPEVKTISPGLHPTSSATWARARSTMPRAFLPSECTEDGLPVTSRAAITAARASGRSGADAFQSRYVLVSSIGPQVPSGEREWSDTPLAHSDGEAGARPLANRRLIPRPRLRTAPAPQDRAPARSTRCRTAASGAGRHRHGR